MVTSEELVKAALAKDEGAFEALVRQNWRAVFGIALAGIGDWQAAEEVAQDAFVSAWSNLSKLRNAGGFSMWLRAIARNLVRNWIRSEEYRRRLAKRDVEGLPHSVPENPAVEAEHDEVLAALDTLSPRLREAVVVFYLEEKSLKETAHSLGITINTLKQRLSRARTRLRTVLESSWEDGLAKKMSRHRRAPARSGLSAMLVAGPAWPSMARSVATHQGKVLPFRVLGEPLLSAPRGLVMTVGGLLVIATAVGVSIPFRIERNSEAPSYSANDPLPRSSEHSNELVSTLYDTGVVEKEEEVSPNEATIVPVDVLADTDSIVDSNEFETIDIEGTVLAKFLGEPRGQVPLADARVIAVVVDPGDEGKIVDGYRHEEQVRDKSRHYVATTNARGEYTLRGIPKTGALVDIVSATGFMTHRKFAPYELDNGGVLRPTFVLSESNFIVVRGVLLDTNRVPIQDAVIQVHSFLGAAKNVKDTTSYLAYTDGRGAFEIHAHGPGVAGLVVTSASLGTTFFHDIDMNETEVKTLTWPSPTTLSGRIVWSDQSAAKGVELELTGGYILKTGLRELSHSRGLRQIATTDSEGSFVFDEPPLDMELRIRLTAQEHGLRSHEIPLETLHVGERRTWNYTFHDVITVWGHVLTPSGRPMSGMMVSCMKNEKRLRGVSAMTDDEGAYTLKVTAGPGQYQIYSHTPHNRWDMVGIPHFSHDVLLGDVLEEQVDFVTDEPTTIHLRVVDSGGNPLDARVEFAFVRYDEDNEYRTAWLNQLATGTWLGKGEFSWSQLMPDQEVMLLVKKAGYGLEEFRAFGGASGGEISETVTLYRNGRVEGIAVDETGAPLVNVQLSYRARKASDSRSFGEHVTTDEKGWFSTNALVPGTLVDLRLSIFNDPRAQRSKGYANFPKLQCVEEGVVDLGTVYFLPNPR